MFSGFLGFFQIFQIFQIFFEFFIFSDFFGYSRILWIKRDLNTEIEELFTPK